MANGVSAVSWGSGHLEIFTRTTTNSLGSGPLLHKWWLGSWGPSQTGWETLDSSTAPATFNVVSRAPNRMDIFRTLVSNQSISRRFWNGSSWSGWQGMGGLSPNTPYAVSWDTNRLDVFVRGLDGTIYLNNTSNGGTTWSGWNSIGAGTGNPSGFTGSPSAVAWGPNRLDVFEQEVSTYHKWWNGSFWEGWEDIGGDFGITGSGAFQNPPIPISWEPGRIDLFQLDYAQNVMHKWSNGVSWGPSLTTWENFGKPPYTP